MFVFPAVETSNSVDDTPLNQHQNAMEMRMIRLSADTPEKTRSRLNKMDGG
jgi:hypothetical protein